MFLPLIPNILRSDHFLIDIWLQGLSDGTLSRPSLFTRLSVPKASRDATLGIRRVSQRQTSESRIHTLPCNFERTPFRKDILHTHISLIGARPFALECNPLDASGVGVDARQLARNGLRRLGKAVKLSASEAMTRITPTTRPFFIFGAHIWRSGEAFFPFFSFSSCCLWERSSCCCYKVKPLLKR